MWKGLHKIVRAKKCAVGFPSAQENLNDVTLETVRRIGAEGITFNICTIKFVTGA